MITIVTPAFNRDVEIQRLYKSLNDQNSKEFEWIIVNDGSTDSTHKIVQPWLENENDFTIQYFLQNNSGKHTALNKALKYANYSYTMIVDSDDFLPADAIETVIEWINDTKNIDSLAGVAGLKSYMDGRIVGEFPESYINVGYIDSPNVSRRKNKLLGDKAEVYKTSILQKFPFPVFPGEKFITEEVVWDRISDAGYSLRWFNKSIYICEYQEDGLTFKGNDIYIDNYQGYTLSTKQRMKLHGRISAFAAAGLYTQISIKKRIKIKEVSRTLEKSKLYILFAFITSKLRGVK